MPKKGTVWKQKQKQTNKKELLVFKKKVAK